MKTTVVAGWPTVKRLRRSCKTHEALSSSLLSASTVLARNFQNFCLHARMAMIHDQEVQAEPHGGALIGVLTRMAWVTGCIIGLAFLFTLLAPGSGTAHAADGPDPVGAVTNPTDVASAVVTLEASSTTVETLWADPATLSATANRRASADAGWSSPLPTSIEASPASPNEPSSRVDVSVPRTVTALSTPLGSLGTGGGSPDAGPSATQLAVLAAGLVVVLWTTQRVRASELAWRSALIISIVERPG